MPSSYSTSLRFEMQLTGEGLNIWGLRLSNSLARIDDSVAGYVALTIPAAGNYTLSSSNNNTVADEARMAHLKLIGSPTTNFSVIIPAVSKSYKVWNATAFTATFSTGSGNTYAIEAGDKLDIWCDGTNVQGPAFGVYNLKDYIAAQTASAGAVPGTTGNLGKFLKVTVDGGASTWQALQTTDFSDYATFFGRFVAIAAAL